MNAAFQVVLTLSPDQKSQLVAVPLSIFSLKTAAWASLGISLCLVELLIWQRHKQKYKLVALSLGLPALILTFGLAFNRIYSPYLHLQILYWMILSTVLVVWGRPLLLQQKDRTPKDAIEAKTSTEIPIGQTGRVLDEGASWQARCEDAQLEIASGQTVCVVRCEGTTLVVLPDYLLRP